MSRRLFTTRHGGLSTGRFASFNLAGHVGEAAEIVQTNRERIASVIGVPAERFAWMDQVHGTAVRVVDAENAGAHDATDGLVTRRSGVALAVLVADCVPVLAGDDEAGVIGVAHAGRVGAAAGIGPALVAAMTGLGAVPARIRVTLGPAICGRCYEVPAAMRDDVEARLPGSAASTSSATPGLDLRSGLRRQFAGLGVTEVRTDPRCTATDVDLYSHRRATRSAGGVPTGRFAGLIWMPEAVCRTAIGAPRVDSL